MCITLYVCISLSKPNTMQVEKKADSDYHSSGREFARKKDLYIHIYAYMYICICMYIYIYAHVYLCESPEQTSFLCAC